MAINLDDLWTHYQAQRTHEARNVLVEAYLDLVKHAARRMKAHLPRNVKFGELMSDGALGLMRAVEAYDPGRKVRFMTYAPPRIRGAMLDGLRERDWLSRQARDRQKRREEQAVAMSHQLGRRLSTEELAEIGGAAPSLGQLDAVTAGLVDRSDPVREAALWDQVQVLLRWLARGNRRDAKIIELYHLDGLTHEAIATLFDISAPWVSQKCTRLTMKLQEQFSAEAMLEATA